jgi:hypothetical protein
MIPMANKVPPRSQPKVDSWGRLPTLGKFAILHLNIHRKETKRWRMLEKSSGREKNAMKGQM